MAPRDVPWDPAASRRHKRKRAALFLLILGFLLLAAQGRGRPVQAQTVTALLPGWNNIVYLGPSGPVMQVLAPIAAELEGVMYWDAGNQRWQVYFSPAPQTSDLTQLQRGSIYWIGVTAAASLPQPAFTPQPSQLVAGWNNVAYLGPGAPLASALEQAPVWYWDSSQQRWLYHDPNATAVSDFSALVPGDAYWLFVQSPGVVPVPATASPPSPPSGCHAFRSSQPSLADVSSALLRASQGLLDVRPDLAAPPMRTGANGTGPLQPPYVPHTIFDALAWVETGWHQASWSTDRGQIGPTLVSKTCAYGILQILTGMQINGTPTLRQAAIGSDYQANAEAGVQILIDDWNRNPDELPYAGRHDPHILEDWYFTLWSYHCYGAVCSQYGAHNNPDDPALPWPRPIYNSPKQLDSSSNWDYSSYPYQELVYGLVAYPPLVGGQPLWAPIAVQLPPHGSVGYPDPQSIPEPSAHLDDGSSVPVAPSASPAAPTATPAPASTAPAILVPPSTP